MYILSNDYHQSFSCAPFCNSVGYARVSYLTVLGIISEKFQTGWGAVNCVQKITEKINRGLI